MLATLRTLASRQDTPVWEVSKLLCSAARACLVSTWRSCTPPIKTFENRALRNWPASIAHSGEFPQRLLYGLKTSHLRFYVGDLRFGPRSDFPAGCPARYPHRQELCDLCKGEPKLLGTPDKYEWQLRCR